MHEESFTFTWLVRNFSMSPVQMGECISSPVIRISKFKNSKWRLKLYPKGKFSEEAIACFLRCDNPGTNRSTVTAKFSLSVSSREKTAENTFKTNACWGYPYFIYMKEILNDKDKYFPNDTLTIKCTIKCMDQIEEVRTRAWESTWKNNYLLNQCYIETTINVETRSVTWTIPRFQTRSCNKMLTLPVFSAMEESPAFDVGLDLSESPTRIKLRKKNKFYDDMFLRCRVSVANAAEKENFYSVKDEVLFKYEDRALTLSPVLNLCDLGKDHLDSLNGDLNLRFDFTFSIYGDVHHVERQLWNPVFSVPKSLPPVKVFSALENEENSVISVRAGDQTFQVHRSVLTAQSEVFRAMLANDMKEKETGLVDIVDVDPHVLNLLLEFLYTNSAPDLSSTDAAKLFAASNKYQIKSLTSLCSSVIVSSLEVTNIFDVLELADLHQDERLLKYAQDFVKVNSDFILVSKEWGDFMERSGTLAAKVLHKILIK